MEINTELNVIRMQNEKINKKVRA